MSNYPAGAEHDPRAPWNQPDNDGLIEDYVDKSIGDLADMFTDLLHEYVRDNVPEGIDEEVYDELYNRLASFWEN